LTAEKVEVGEKKSRELGGVTPGSYVLFSATDTGSGMSDEVKTHLFEPFFTTKEGGKGLGLSTVFGIVRQHQGAIDVQSELGVGTHIQIYFPQIAPVQEASLVAAQAPASARPRILLAEDESAVRTLVARLLRREGYEVLEAGNGQEAMMVMFDHVTEPIDLLITDFMMPEMGGKQLMEKSRKIHPRTKILLMSAYTSQVFSEGRLDPGVAFLQKPFSSLVLVTKVQEVLRAS
jgi:CheY-like chemotaxis protein